MRFRESTRNSAPFHRLIRTISPYGKKAFWGSSKLALSGLAVVILGSHCCHCRSERSLALLWNFFSKKQKNIEVLFFNVSCYSCSWLLPAPRSGCCRLCHRQEVIWHAVALQLVATTASTNQIHHGISTSPAKGDPMIYSIPFVSTIPALVHISFKHLCSNIARHFPPALRPDLKDFRWFPFRHVTLVLKQDVNARWYKTRTQQDSKQGLLFILARYFYDISMKPPHIAVSCRQKNETFQYGEKDPSGICSPRPSIFECCLFPKRHQELLQSPSQTKLVASR